MEKDEDIFRIISDFMKGKSGSPDMSMAKLYIEGDIHPDDLKLPPMSATFTDFLKEYPTVRKVMAKYSLEHCLQFLGAMLTLPEFQSNAYRLEVLVHMAFLCAKGNSRPTAGHAAAWFNNLDNGTCGRQEDPAEDVFISIVSYKSVNYRIFEGTAEGNNLHTQLFLDILADMPAKGLYAELKASVENLLKLSDAVAERSGLYPYVVGNTSPVGRIGKPDGRVWSELGKRVALSFEELATMGIDPRTLRPFIAKPEDTENLADQSLGNSTIDAKPIFPTKRGLIVFMPGLIGTAIRDLMIRRCIAADMSGMLHKALGNAYSALFAGEILLGTSSLTLNMQPHGKLLAAQAVKEIDAGRYLHLLFIIDHFEGFENGAFMGMNNIREWSDLVAKCVDQVHAEFSVRDGFREGLTMVIGCGWGRGVGLGLGEPIENWRIEMMPAHDAVTLGRAPSFKTLDLLRMLDALEALDEMGIHLSNASGLLNLYAWMKSNDGHIVPHEKLDDDFVGEPGSGNLAIPTNCNLGIRHQAHLAADIRALARPDGSIARLRRAHGTPRYGSDELSPFYVDLEALAERVYRSVYAGQNGIYWIEANTGPGLDQSIRYELSKMIMYWAEAAFKYLDDGSRMASASRVFCTVSFHERSLPDASEPIPAAEDIASFIEYQAKLEDYGLIVHIDIKDGFLNFTRRPDNLGERAIVAALVTAILGHDPATADEGAIDEVVKAIVRSDNARHFHAFAVPQLRDHVRADLPESAQVIEQMDDTNGRLGLGWLCRDRSDGSLILGLSECKDYLRKLVDVLIGVFLGHLATFNRASLVEAMLRNHEAAISELDTWKRTYGAIEALSNEASLATHSAIERMGRLNAASMASRIVIEAAVCASPVEGGLTPGEYDMGQLMALAAMVHHMGGYSEAMTAGIMPPEIKISPAGDVMMQHEFSEDVVRPFGEFFQTKSLKDAASSYIEHYTSPDVSSEAAEQAEGSGDDEKEFEAAWLEEYGFSLDDLGDFLSGFHAILETDGKAVLPMTHAGLMGRLQAETGMSEESIAACMGLFTYQPRDVWNASPDGFTNFAWFPWRFRRQLSIVSRPIIQLTNGDEAGYLIAPAMVIASIAKFVSDARMGGIDQKSFRENGPMFRWVGSIRDTEGEAFNVEVANKFLRIGWEAKPNLSDGQILGRKKDPRFGDVDVLAWNKEQGKVLIIECKDLSFDKTTGEIAWRLSKYQGEAKPSGRRDDLRRHLDRCEVIEANLDLLSNFVGFDVQSSERILLLSQLTPLQFAKITERHNVRVVTFSEIEDMFS